MLIDTHCHLTSGGLVERAAEVVENAHQAGVHRLITVAVNPTDATTALDLLERFPNIYLVVGLHPHEANKATPEVYEQLRSLTQGDEPASSLRNRIVAVGEIGLDFHYDFAPPERQEEVFDAQLALAGELGLPVVIHARRSEQRVCEILANHPNLIGRVVFHCYSGDKAQTRQVLDLGCYCSFTGVVTFKKSDDIRASAQMMPTDRIFVETDAPYLSPEPVRKIRPCEPALLVHTARFLAELRGDTFENFSQTTTANAVKFFSLPEETA